MPEVENVGPWVQPETIRTREQHAVVSGLNLNVGHVHGELMEHSGAISYGHFVTEVLNPALETVMNATLSDEFASQVANQRWLSTPLATFFDAATYRSQMHVTGSGLALHDFDPLASYFTEKTAEVEADFLATHPGVNPGDVIVDFEGYGTWPIGVYANRTIEVDMSPLPMESWDREGNSLGTSEGAVLPHSILGVPLSEGPHVYQTVIFEDAIWTGTHMDDAFGHSWVEAHDFELLTDGSGFAEGVTRLDVPDATWAAVSGPISGGSTGYTSSGMALILGPAFAVIEGYGDEPILMEETDDLWQSAAVVWLESDWTPPRYRVRWFTTPGVLRHYPRRGDGRGWGGVVRGYPSVARRGYGGARQP